MAQIHCVQVTNLKVRPLLGLILVSSLPSMAPFICRYNVCPLKYCITGIICGRKYLRISRFLIHLQIFIYFIYLLLYSTSAEGL